MEVERHGPRELERALHERRERRALDGLAVRRRLEAHVRRPEREVAVEVLAQPGIPAPLEDLHDVVPYEHATR